MPQFILHHYAGSPFSEKVRLIFGYKSLEWQSVVVPVMMPKPDVMALTGGYRRTPFLQIGADVYCDTALMCRVIERLAPAPTLYPASSAGLADIVAQWADSALFWTAVPYTLQPAAVPHLFPGASPEFMKSFGADRAAMNPSLRRATPADGAAHLRSYLGRLEHMLADGREFLLGAEPCIADFSAAQSIWFVRRAPPVAVLLGDFPTVTAWYARVDAFGQGSPMPLDSGDAIAIAAASREKAATSVAGGQGFNEGDAVTVTPTDYAHDPVAGRLVGLADDEIVIARDDERAGSVHVHFPRLGFQLKAQSQ